MIISRIPAGAGFKYADGTGAAITDPAALEYIKSLVIPPAYRDVVIFYEAAGQPKILFQGYDSKNRLQRIYSEMWRSKATRRKYCELIHFAEQAEAIAAHVRSEMAGTRLTKKKCIAMIIRIMMLCYFRVGNKRYQELYGSFGAMNIQKRHVTFKTDAAGRQFMFISFVGKKSVLNTCDVYDADLIREMRTIMSAIDDGDPIFRYLEHGDQTVVRAIDVNAWLNRFSGYITSKVLRTYDANIMLIIYLRAKGAPAALTRAERKKNIVGAMRVISAQIHNTPAILRKNYTQGGIIDMYIDEPIKYAAYFAGADTPGAAFLRYLRDFCRDYDVGAELKSIAPAKRGGGGKKMQRGIYAKR